MYRKNAELNKLVKFINTPTRSWETKVCNEDPNLDQNCEMRKVKQSGGGGETTSSENDTNESDANSKIPESENQDISVSGQNTGADSGSKIYMNSEKELSALDVIEIFRHVDVTKNVDETDFRPKGKNVFVIGARNGNVKNEDWKADGYTWKRYGTKKVKVNDEGAYLCKMYYKLMNQNSADERLKKHVFKMENDENLNLILIQYIGDETIFVPQPHGNNKKRKNEYVRTKPSVLNKTKDHTAKNPVSVMNKINLKINAPCKETGFSNLRNKRQVINMQSRLRKQQGLGPDALYNLHQLFYHLDGYITDIVTAPDLIVLLQMKDMLEEFDRLLQLKSDEAVPLFYDTTFNLGDFYVSTLSFQHILFYTPPLIPLAIMIHERNFQKCHEMLFNSVKQRIPRLKDKNLAIVTDRETGIINAIKNVFPNLTLLICWNHILRDTKEWLRKNGKNEQNTLEIVKQIKCLLESPSEEAFDTLLNGGSGVRGFRVIWSQLFVTYFDKQLAPTLKKTTKKTCG